jgi:hypothetical protein
VWRRYVKGEEVRLTLRDTGYHIQRGPESGSGRISVTAGQIEFFGGSRCDGRGTYTWSFEEDRLRFVEVDDPCSGRTDVLLLGTFGRISD